MQDSDAQTSFVNQCPDCGHSIDVSALSPFSKVVCPHCGSSVRVRTRMGKYEIVGMLGTGGMSQVFRAVDMHLQREVALKILHQSLSSDSALTAMFEREAKLTASILHPNVVKVYTVGQEQGYFFIAMELVDATSLEELISTRGAIPESEVLRVAHDVTNGLLAAREEGLIHRDIKPGNMLVTAEGVTKLVDFGLAVQQGGEDLSKDLWATPFYVPPEKLDGKTDTFLGDIYSLGATLYHALAGKPPFDANTSSLEELKVIKANPVSLKGDAPGTSKPTIKLIESMMAHQASARPQEYEEILSRIEEIEQSQFGIQRGAGMDTVKMRWLVIGIFSALTAVIVAITVQLNNEDSATPGEVGSLGIGEGERVISVGEDANARLFLEGREMLAQGKFRRAEEIFDSLAVETTQAPETRMWTHFFHGLVRLFIGKEVEARRSFGLVQALAPEERNDTAEALVRISRSLSEPLPVMPSDIKYSASGVEPAGWLAVGLKNWQMGEFASGANYLQRFVETEIASGFEWLAALKEEAKPFLRDFNAIAAAPNPSRDSESALQEQKDALATVLADAKTSGSFPRLIQSRMDRIEKIEKLAAEEDWEKLEMAAQSNTSSEPTSSETAESSAEEKEDRVQLASLLPTLSEYGETLLFSGAIAKLESETLRSDEGRKLRSDLVEAYSRASEFVPMLSGMLDAGTYEGTVRRREGVPLDAKITGADSSAFIVDLGFGPNEVDVELFAPDWLVETAGQFLGPPSVENIEDWKRVVYFAFATNQGEESLRLGDTIEGVDPEFDQRWDEIGSLIGPEAMAAGDTGSED